jgi:membrane associated rhomboid family serine protease
MLTETESMKSDVLGTVMERDNVEEAKDEEEQLPVLSHQPTSNNRSDGDGGGGGEGDNDSDIEEDKDCDELERVKFFLQCVELLSNDENYDKHNNEEVIDNSRVAARKSTRSISTTSSLLDDPDVLDALRTSLRSPGGLAQGLEPIVAVWIKLFEFAQTQRFKKYRVRPYGIVGLFSNLSDIRSDLTWAQDAAHRRKSGKPYVAWADFYRKEQQGLVRPYFTYMIILASVVMMVFAFYRNDWVIEPMKVNPLLGPSPRVLLDLGALQGRFMIENRQWWRLITPMVLHAGIVHLLLNMAVMVLIGRTIERNHGFLHTSSLFVASAIGGNMLSALMQPGFILVGASGGIFGLMGLCVADIVLNWRLLFLVFEQRQGGKCERGDKNDNNDRKADFNKRQFCCCPPNYNFLMRFNCGFWLCVDLFINSSVGFTPYVDNYAHLGGLVYGFFFSLSTLRRLPMSFFAYHERESTRLGWWCHLLRILLLRFLGVPCGSLLMIVSFVLLSQSNGLVSPCPKCRYISCLPFPFWVSDEKKWWACDICQGVNSQIYKRRGIEYYSDLDLYCPQGYTAHVDVFEKRYTAVEEAEADLVAICQEHCTKKT